MSLFAGSLYTKCVFRDEGNPSAFSPYGTLISIVLLVIHDRGATCSLIVQALRFMAPGSSPLADAEEPLHVTYGGSLPGGR